MKPIDVLFQKSYKNILILKFFGFGTILLAAPALSKIKKAYPSTEITIFTLSSNYELCEMLPSIDKIICLNIDNFLTFVITFIKAFLGIRRRKFNVIIDLEFITNFSALITLLTTLFANRKTTVGFNSPIKWRNSVYDVIVSFDHSRHITKIFSKLVSSLAINDFALNFRPIRDALLKHADVEYLANLIEANDPLKKCDYFLCVNINAGVLSLNRRWPKEYFNILIRKLIEESNVGILLIGGKEDVDYVSDFQIELPLSPRIINLCGKTSLKQLIGLLSKSNLLITNDSGILHAAHVTGLSTISFFGPETPYLYGPIGKIHHVFYDDLFCSPCINIYNSKMSRCKDNICLKSITPDTVIELVKKKYLFKTL
tara:strand:+ start:4435 stop:5547 length:1113 start_codon:yes stop_codon:yes gene_type:complete